MGSSVPASLGQKRGIIFGASEERGQAFRVAHLEVAGMVKP